MNIDFSNIANLTPIGFARFLFDSTKPDGTLHIPKNFGTEFESDDEFNIFKMSWGREELDQLILKFNALYAGLSEIAKVYDELDDNDEGHVRSVLDDSALFDIWRIYVRRLECDEFDNDKLDFALEKEYNQNMFSKNPDKQIFDERLFEKFTEDENEWIIKNHDPCVTIKEFTEQYNRIFCENRSVETMKHHINRLGMKQKNKGYTIEQDKWLLENCEHLSVKEPAEMFNKLFAEKRSEGALKARALKLGVTHKNDRSKQKYQVGAETKLNGITYVKTSNEKKDFYKNWEPKGRVVYKKSY